MSFIQTQLDVLDTQLQAYTRQQQWMISFSSALGILLFGWFFYVSDAIDALIALQDENAGLVEKISQNSPSMYASKIKTTDKSLEKEKIHEIELNAQKEAMISEMSFSQGLILGNEHYAKMLDLLLQRSVALQIKIESMDSQDTNKTYFGKVNQVKKLTIKGIGRFPAIAQLIAFSESQNVLVQVESLHVEANQEKPSFELVLLYMGVVL